MITEDKDFACLLAMALRWRQIESKSVVAWADSIIADRPEPPVWAIDLSMPPRPWDELVSLLRDVPGAATGKIGSMLFLALLRRKWLAGELTGPQVGRILYGLLQEGDLPFDLASEVYSIDDSYDLVEGGYCDKAAVDEDLRLFLDSYQQYDPLLAKASL